MTSIQQVISVLQKISTDCKTTKNKAGFFAALYLRMTRAVAEGIQNNNFDDGSRMERLDVAFAQRYIDAYDAYFNGRPCQPAWKLAFDACRNDNLIVFQHLLLGINTHINLDLAIAAAQTCPGDKIKNLQNDFLRINQIIGGLADDIQECLCKIWWPMRLLTKIANGRQTDVLNFSIDKARNASWSNANLLATLPATNSAAYILQMDSTTSCIANAIINPGFLRTFLLKQIRTTEYADTEKIIALILETEVQ